MSEPRRLLEDPASCGRLVDALQGYPAPVEIAPQALQALGAALGQSAAPAAAVPAGVGALAKVGVAKLCTIVLSVGVGTVGVCVWSGNVVERSSASVAMSSSTFAPIADPVGSSPKATTDAVRVEDLVVVPETAPRPSGSEPLASKGNPSQLKEEASLLEAARSALVSAPNRALEQTTLHRLRFARPLLGLERDLVEIDAHCRLGHDARATELVNALLAEQPQGMYAKRARALLLQGCGK